MAQNASKASMAIGIAVTLFLALIGRSPKNTPGITLILLSAIFILLTYSVSQTPWITKSKRATTTIIRTCLVIAPIMVGLFFLGLWVWPAPVWTCPGSLQFSQSPAEAYS